MMANRFGEMNDNRNFSLEILLACGKFLYLATQCYGSLFVTD